MSSTGQLHISLAAIQKNWLLLNEMTADNVDCASVVKANAYGLGAIPVARALYHAGCRIFFVATLEEAVELREARLGDCQIVILGGMASNAFTSCEAYKLIPTLVTLSQVYEWRRQCCQAGKLLPSIIKLDTGMHRFGLALQDMEELLTDQKCLADLSPMMIMSHLACADRPSHDLNEKQLNAFSSVYTQLRHQLPSIRASLANSSGVFLGDSYHFNLVRPGASLYGVNPTQDHVNPMGSVVSLYLPINQIKSINPGDSVGYGATYHADRVTRIAVVFGGYADGLFRLLGNNGKGFCGGYPVPMVGRISMDAIAFDITSVPAEVLSEADNMIEILGANQSVDELASKASTIGYEVLTSLGSRYHRVYSDGLCQ